MKASPRQQRLLLDLQDLDTRLARLERRRRTLPERDELAATENASNTAKTEFMNAQRQLDVYTAEIERIESDVRLVAERTARDESLIAASTSSKEAQALQQELETLARRTEALEEKQLDVMQQQDDAQRQFDAASAGLDAIARGRQEITDRLNAAEEAIDAEVAAVRDERDGLSAELQRDILSLYEEIRAKVGIGAARLRGGVSEASNMALTPAELSTIRAAAPDELVFCPGTGAILVADDADE